MEAKIEIRCPNSPRKLLAILLRDGEKPKIVDGNLIELLCKDCRRLLKKSGREVSRVLHRYDLAGELIETVEMFDNLSDANRESLSDGELPLD
jgi:hypothetical protein